MPIAINGSGTITGVSVGGLPDGIVDTDMIAADAVTAAKVGTKTFTSYAIICDQKTSSTDGGTFTSGAHRTRDLNTEIFDPDGIVSISSNQFTLGAGTYLIRASAPAYEVGRHAIRLKNVTDNTNSGEGTAEFTKVGNGIVTRSVVNARITITASKAFEIRHKSESTRATNGFGARVDAVALHSIYTTVEIYKEA